MDSEKRLAENEIEQAITEYGAQVTIPPNGNYDDVDIYDTGDINEVNVDYDLWIDNKKVI